MDEQCDKGWGRESPAHIPRMSVEHGAGWLRLYGVEMIVKRNHGLSKDVEGSDI
jgi:hypothetical protein